MRKLISIAALLACTASGIVYADEVEEGLAKKSGSSKSASSSAEDSDGEEGSSKSGKDGSKEAFINPGCPGPSFSNVPCVQDGRIKVLPYDETDVYTITTKPGYQTNVVFSRTEEIETISVGDRSFWQIIPAGNRMFIRPMDEDVTTNMTVITNLRSYQFDLTSIPADSKEGNIYVAKFVYPPKKPKTPPPGAPVSAIPAGLVAAQAAPQPTPPTEAPPATPWVAATPTPPSANLAPNLSPPPCLPPACKPTEFYAPSGAAMASTATPAGPGITQPVNPNFNYTYSGPDDISPLQVYDDGKSTYIMYRAQPLPSVYLVDGNKQEQSVNYYVKDDYLVVDNVASEMVLKSNGRTVRIYNELLNPQ
jgi:type IV secretion system protein VirB9